MKRSLKAWRARIFEFLASTEEACLEVCFRKKNRCRGRPSVRASRWLVRRLRKYFASKSTSWFALEERGSGRKKLDNFPRHSKKKKKNLYDGADIRRFEFLDPLTRYSISGRNALTRYRLPIDRSVVYADRDLKREVTDANARKGIRSFSPFFFYGFYIFCKSFLLFTRYAR